MPRKIRRLVGVLKIVGLSTRSSSPSEREWSMQDQLARAPGALGAEMRLEPAFPVRVSERRRARGDGELAAARSSCARRRRRRDAPGSRARRRAAAVRRARCRRSPCRRSTNGSGARPARTSSRCSCRPRSIRTGSRTETRSADRRRPAAAGWSERMTASPRKTCVPGVQACATAGDSDDDQRPRAEARAARAPTRRRATRAARAR